MSRTRVLKPYWPLALVLAAATLLRVATTMAYWPGLMWDDSWEYISLAWMHPFVGFTVDHPSGYPAIVWLLTVAHRGLAPVLVAQHLAGLVGAALVYLLVARLTGRRWLAAAAAALVALDGYAVALEEYVMSEPFFGLFVLLSAYLAIFHRERRFGLPASGLCLAIAVAIRTAGVFVVPVWLVYVLWAHADARRIASGLAALVIPLLIYCGVHAADGRGFGMTQSGAWFLYSRVGPITDCAGISVPPEERPLCRTTDSQGQRYGSPADFIFDSSAPAVQMFGDPYTNTAHSSAVLQDFALRMIRHRPIAYLKMVSDDLLAYFDPIGGGKETVVQLPFHGQQDEIDTDILSADMRYYRRQWHWPYRFTHAYVDRLHTPRWLMGGLAAISLVAVLLGIALRRLTLIPSRREIFLLSGMAIASILGQDAVVNMEVRFLVAVVPLLVCGGVLALNELAIQGASNRRAPGNFAK